MVEPDATRRVHSHDESEVRSGIGRERGDGAGKSSHIAGPAGRTGQRLGGCVCGVVSVNVIVLAAAGPPLVTVCA
jgi:hypothetical protein